MVTGVDDSTDDTDSDSEKGIVMEETKSKLVKMEVSSD